MARILLIVAHDGFQTKEYHDPKRVLEAAGHTVLTASDGAGEATSNIGERVMIDVTLDAVHPEDYDAIYFVGGPGALPHLDNEASYRVLRAVAALGKPFGGICLAPRILAHAGVLSGARATGWDRDGKLAEVYGSSKTRYERAPVVVDVKIITAEGPSSATAFGEAIAASLAEG